MYQIRRENVNYTNTCHARESAHSPSSGAEVNEGELQLHFSLRLYDFVLN
jgi:hypothetical protein